MKFPECLAHCQYIYIYTGDARRQKFSARNRYFSRRICVGASPRQTRASKVDRRNWHRFATDRCKVSTRTRSISKASREKPGREKLKNWRVDHKLDRYDNNNCEKKKLSEDRSIFPLLLPRGICRKERNKKSNERESY